MRMSEEWRGAWGRLKEKGKYFYLLSYTLFYIQAQSLGGEGKLYQSCAIKQVTFKQLNKAGVYSGGLSLQFVNFYSFSLLINILVSSGLHGELRCKS